MGLRRLGYCINMPWGKDWQFLGEGKGTILLGNEFVSDKLCTLAMRNRDFKHWVG